MTTQRKRRMTRESVRYLKLIADKRPWSLRVYVDVRTCKLPTWATLLADRGYITMDTSYAIGTAATITDAGLKYLEDAK